MTRCSSRRICLDREVFAGYLEAEWSTGSRTTEQTNEERSCRSDSTRQGERKTGIQLDRMPRAPPRNNYFRIRSSQLHLGPKDFRRWRVSHTSVATPEPTLTMLRNLTRAARRTATSPALRRPYVVGSSTHLRPATAAAQSSEVYDSHEAQIIHDTLAQQSAYRSSDGHLKPLPARATTATPPLHRPGFTILPSPIPDDRPIRGTTDIPPPNSPHARTTQSELYPSTGLLDALSLISVCLQKRETVPRGYEIFKRILADVSAGRCAVPDAAVWGSVIEATTALGKPDLSIPSTDARRSEVARLSEDAWIRRGRELVGLWEEVNGAGTDPQGSRVRVYGLKRGGEKVYQGWLRGLLQ